MKLKEFLFSKKYGSLHYRLSYFFYAKIPFISKGWNEYHNPWYHWWKVRKYFKRPKAHFLFRRKWWMFGFPCKRDYYNQILDINFSALGWKDKWNSPRHEWDPYINIVLFRRWHLIWLFSWYNEKDPDSNTRSMATWEAILDYLYYNKSVKWIVNNHRWGHVDDGEIITIESNLTEEGKNVYK